MIYNQLFCKIRACWPCCGHYCCPPTPLLLPPKMSYVLAYATTLQAKPADIIKQGVFLKEGGKQQNGLEMRNAHFQTFILLLF